MKKRSKIPIFPMVSQIFLAFFQIFPTFFQIFPDFPSIFPDFPSIFPDFPSMKPAFFQLPGAGNAVALREGGVPGPLAGRPRLLAALLLWHGVLCGELQGIQCRSRKLWLIYGLIYIITMVNRLWLITMVDIWITIGIYIYYNYG